MSFSWCGVHESIFISMWKRPFLEGWGRDKMGCGPRPLPMSPAATPESILCLNHNGGGRGVGMGTQNSGPGPHAGRTLRPPSLTRPLCCLKLRELRHLLHGDGVDEPGIGALGEKERKREKIQAWASPTRLWEPRQPRHPGSRQCPSQARERA